MTNEKKITAQIKKYKNYLSIAIGVGIALLIANLMIK